MAKRDVITLKDLDVAFHFMKNRSRVGDISVLPLGNNIALFHNSDHYQVFISTNPEARIMKNNFIDLPELDSGNWVEYLVVRDKASKFTFNQDLANEKYISEFVTKKLNGFITPIIHQIKKEKLAKDKQTSELIRKTQDNWKNFIGKMKNT